MEKILFINACIRPDSRTLELANYVLTRLSGKVEEVELYKKDLSPLTLEEMEVRNKAFKNNVLST